MLTRCDIKWWVVLNMLLKVLGGGVQKSRKVVGEKKCLSNKAKDITKRGLGKV